MLCLVATLSRRNQVLHHQPDQDASTLIQWTEDYLYQHDQHNDGTTPLKFQDGSQPPFQWQPPPIGHLKLNVDAAQNTHWNRMGFGNHKAEVVAALAIPWKGIHQPLIMEAHALQLTLDWCQKNSIGINYLESDCQTLIHAIHSGCTIKIHLQELLHKIISLLSSLPQASIGYIQREANSTAHQLAKQALGLD
ncbi:hypothetical protein F8388_021042 [Cannabis sativa]|uniref:RNase H type-1 domain-containing protein n=1 Tax=Cannabis sativa TaxID=3483 RepID=A0A7J6ETV9_CANSA|nr:hypothetical protein G4B88_000420 [Cannabis sativa]KAF4388212.1 hypothetical protein F8388_021042 [Cannabis sativa]